MDYSAKKAVSTIKIVHFALISGLTLFVLITSYLIISGSIGGGSLDFPFIQYIPALIVIAAFLLSTFVFKDSVKKITTSASLQSKIAGFNTAHIMKMALLEGAGLVTTVLALKSADLIMISAPIVIIILMLFQTPSAFKLEGLLGLTPEEKEELMN